MLVVALEKLPEGVKIWVNLASIDFILRHQPKGQPEPSPDSCILCVRSGATLHVKQTEKAIMGMMNNARGR